jgi:hypothetical protein
MGFKYFKSIYFYPLSTYEFSGSMTIKAEGKVILIVVDIHTREKNS